MTLLYVIRKLLFTIPILMGVALMVFVVMQLTPGDPAEIALGDGATPELVAKLRQEWGLDLPLHQQYMRFLAQAVSGDLGRSFRTNTSVAEDLARTMPATFLLALSGMVIAAVVGVPAGVVSATRQNSALDHASMLAALMGVSAPAFWVGMLLMLVFSYHLGLLPSSGYGSMRHLILPSLTIGLANAGMVARMTRASMLDVLKEDYIRTAYSKGLRNYTVTFKHALRNALIPVVTSLGVHFGILLGGAIVTESVFAWPGVGRLMVTAILARDLPVVRAAVLYVAAAFVIVNTLVDISYGILDPRIRYEQ